MARLAEVVISAVALLASASVKAQDPSRPTRQQLQLVSRPDRTPRGPESPREPRSAYLLTYFKEHVHSLHFAVSRDGYEFTDVNGGKPVLSGAAVASQKGIRDPYLMRGPDGAFYLTMTDLHIYARQEGLRATQWERPASKYGWGNNRSIILMKSRDLIHWTAARVDLTRLFRGYRNMGIAWAPEVFFDTKNGRMMVYFSTRMGTGPNYLVYSYADPTFRTLTTTPQPLFALPRASKSAVDGDISRVGGRYHLFFSTDDGAGNIRQAVSNRLTGDYVFNRTKIDPEAIGTEAPMLWRRYGTRIYVLMYDVYAAKPNNMGFSETTDFRTFRALGRFNDAGSPMKATNFDSPKHGAITAITPSEARRLEQYFAR